MAINKIVLNTETGEQTLVDLTGDTVTPETLAEGTTAHAANGEQITGVAPADAVRYSEQVLTEEQKTQARGNIDAQNKLPSGGSSGQVLSKKSDADNDLQWSDPTPDVSGQINTHNTNTAAHADIRAEITKSYDKVISMGEQLVINGTGFMGNNTNFSWWDFDGSQGNGSPGSFTKAAKKGGMVQLDELIPVNATKAYEWKLDLKSEKGISKFYTFIQCYDADKLEMYSNHIQFRAGSTTKLAKDLVAGDTVLYLEDVSGWAYAANYTFARIWNYKNSFGYAYPKETYSRKNLSLLVSNGSFTIDATNKTVALASAYTGETIPAGTDLSQGFDGHSYRYYPLSNVTIPAVWTSYSGVLSGTDFFYPGTAYVRLRMFWNDRYDDDRQWMTNVSFKEAVSAGVTTAEMNEAISSAVGDINAVLDEINGEVV